MTITLPPEMEELVAKKVESGRYSSAGDVIVDGLKLLRAQDDLNAIQTAALRREIDEGIEQADRGDLHSANDVFRILRERNAGIRSAA